MQYTTSKFYRINGGSTQNKGVIPDILLPSAIDPAEWGESQEDNALPWDNIRPARYQPSAEIRAKVKMLTDRHLERISVEPEFAFLATDIKEYKENKDKNFVSLNEKERLAEKDDNSEKRLARRNLRLERLGFEKVKDLEQDTPEELDQLDPFLEETARITADLVSTSQ